SSFKKTAAGPRRLQLEKYMRVVRCPSCGGQRLNPQARGVRVGDKTIVELCAMPIGDLADWFAEPETGRKGDREIGRKGDKETRRQRGGEGSGSPCLHLSLSPLQHFIADEVLKEIRGRLGFLLNVGLHYLTLERSAP